MVLGIGSTSGTETPPVNPLQSSSSPPPPPILTGVSFYIVPQGPTPPLNFPTPSFRQYFNFFPTYPGLNPVQPWVQPPNRAETLNFPILHGSDSGSGSGPILPDNSRTNPGLRFGSSPNPSENHFSENLRTNDGLHLGSETNHDENRNNPPIPRYGLQTNRAEDLSIPILRHGSGSSLSLSDNLRTNSTPTFRFGSPPNHNEPIFRFGSPLNLNETRNNPVFEFGSSTNPDERRSNPAFEFGSSANPNERRSNPVFEFGSSANPIECKNNPIFGFCSSSIRPKELGSLFRRISVFMNNREENRSSQVVPCFGASPNRDENVGLVAGSNRVENNEPNNRAWAIDMLLEAARPVDQDEVEEPVEMEHEEKAKSSDETDEESDSDGDEDEEERDEVEGNGELDEERAGEEEEAKEEGEGEENEAEEQLVKTWNLRPRKPATTKSPIVGSTSRVRARAGRPRPQGLRGVPPRARMEDTRPTISLSLTKEEIEADFLKMTGEKPSKKPTKRTRSVQKKIDMLFPGGRLTTVTRERHHVPDPLLKP